MGKRDRIQVSDFSYEGRFLSFIALDGYKLKYIRLSTSDGDRTIKIPKEQRLELYRSLKPGDLVRCAGEQKLNIETGDRKLKAYTIDKTVPQVSHLSMQALGRSEVIHLHSDRGDRHVQKQHAKPLVNVLVCQKSDCAKRGSGEVCAALVGALELEDLAGYVKVKSTGCLKHCKSGPYLVVMPDKSHFSHVKVSNVPDIIAAIRDRVSAQTMPEAG
jgi:(2Fe-2S) ferredoxin